MPMPSLTLPAARLVHLASQGLLTPPPAPATKADILAAIKRMQLLQIDTIHVVARSPYFDLFSRLGNYEPLWLDELLSEGQVFEQWAHAACYIPIEDYPLIRGIVLAGIRSSYFSGWIESNQDVISSVLETIRSNGPVKSADFKSEKGPGGWWNWKIEKAALEYLFSRGDVIVIRRENFQRVYELTERAMPGWDDSTIPKLEEVYRELILKSVKTLGIARRQWVADYFRLPKRTVALLLPQLVKEGRLGEVNVEGWEEPALYVPENEVLIQCASHGELHANYTALLSPFDPVTWDRERARQLFKFDFMIQAYTRAEKRQYGYFPLPILHDGALVGRLDAKANRQSRLFEIKGFYFEKDVEPSEYLLRSIAEAITRCAIWHKTPRVSLADSVPIELARQLGQYIQ